jgi:hypothetical protein
MSEEVNPDEEYEDYVFGDIELADDEDEIIGVCIECHSDQPESYMERQLEKRWQGPGDFSVPCKLCGGVVKVVSRSQRNNFLAIQDRRRGLFSQPKRDEE